jgi:hypothetical protein
MNKVTRAGIVAKALEHLLSNMKLYVQVSVPKNKCTLKFSIQVFLHRLELILTEI